LSHDEAVSAQFSPRAGAYVTSPVHAAGEDLDLLEQVLEIRRPARVLDLGTGGGHVAFRAAPFATQVVAYDLSDAMLEQVAAEATRRGHANIATRQGFAESLPFEDASFDAVLTRFSAHHWHDVPRALAEARRVLGPGGIAVFIDVVAPESPLADTWLQSLELMRDPSHVRDYRRSEWLLHSRRRVSPQPSQGISACAWNSPAGSRASAPPNRWSRVSAACKRKLLLKWRLTSGWNRTGVLRSKAR